MRFIFLSDRVNTPYVFFVITRKYSFVRRTTRLGHGQLLSIFAFFQVSSTKIFQQYKSKLASEKENRIVVFFIVILVSNMRLKLFLIFYCGRGTIMKCWRQLGRGSAHGKLSKVDKGGERINFDQKIVDVNCQLCPKLMSKHTLGSTVWRFYIQNILPVYEDEFWFLFHFCHSNYVGSLKNKQCILYWKKKFVEKNYADEVSLWTFWVLWEFF